MKTVIEMAREAGIDWNDHLDDDKTNRLDHFAELVRADAQRTWVGLTDEERVDLWKATETDNRMVLIDAIEARLREKNND